MVPGVAGTAFGGAAAAVDDGPEAGVRRPHTATPGDPPGPARQRAPLVDHPHPAQPGAWSQGPPSTLAGTAMARARAFSEASASRAWSPTTGRPTAPPLSTRRSVIPWAATSTRAPDPRGQRHTLIHLARLRARVPTGPLADAWPPGRQGAPRDALHPPSHLPPPRAPLPSPPSSTACPTALPSLLAPAAERSATVGIPGKRSRGRRGRQHSRDAPGGKVCDNFPHFAPPRIFLENTGVSKVKYGDTPVTSP